MEELSFLTSSEFADFPQAENINTENKIKAIIIFFFIIKLLFSLKLVCASQNQIYIIFKF